MKKIFIAIKIILIVALVVISFSSSNIFESKVKNNNLNKVVNTSKMAMKITEFDYSESYTPLDTFTGDLTGYVFDCPLCGGTLGCLRSYNIKDGTTTYPDSTYGNVRIVASSVNLPCGSIIRINSSRISADPVYAIVLDRGVAGTSIDLLVDGVQNAYSLGRSSITYDVLRNGW